MLLPAVVRASLLLASFALVGCFDPNHFDPSILEERAPEDEPLPEGEGGVCIEFEEPCTRSDACCLFDAAYPVGGSVCVATGEEATCASVCTNDEDCSSGCCAVLDGVPYGACVDSSFC